MEYHVVVPPAIVLQVRQAGPAAVGAVHHVVGFASGDGLVAAAGVLAALVPQGDQPAQMNRDVVGLAHVQRQGGPVQALAEQVPAQE
jgi:hypothetical protein